MKRSTMVILLALAILLIAAGLVVGNGLGWSYSPVSGAYETLGDYPPGEITGDQVYFSPEALLHNMGRPVAVTEKADIFALGLLFHQYWCGTLPGFDREEHRYANEALLEGDSLLLNIPALPGDVRALLDRMLALDPAERPSARQAWESLSGETIKILNTQFYALSDDDL